MKNILILIVLFSAYTAFSQRVPYDVNKKKYPLGQDFRKLLPEELGGWSRFSFHDYIPGREQGLVYYRKGGRQIDLSFGKASSQEDMSVVWRKIYDNATDGREQDIKQKDLSASSVKYFVLNGRTYMFAWTRNLYYFSISASNKSDADEFMRSFPW
jgi:hypothetical protein